MAFGKRARPWSVQEAKAKLSEVLRKAREEGPQLIGTEHPCVVVPLEAWEERSGPREHLGRWLVRTAPHGAALELPARQDADRPTGLDEPTRP
jgi:prevent-host-death family protein